MLLAINKPTWITSYDVIRQLKRVFPKKKIGHSGTLDPMATGLLLIWIDKDTKKLGHLQWLSKQYITKIDFAKMSDTRDMDYWEEFEELDIAPENAPNIENIKTKLNWLVPSAMLPLTPFSAKKKNWKKLYELARKWEKIIEDKEMKVLWYKILDYTFPELELALEVWSGTYIRSIGYWLWQEFGLGGILTSLRRTSIGDIAIENLKLEKIGKTDLMWCEIL